MENKQKGVGDPGQTEENKGKKLGQLRNGPCKTRSSPKTLKKGKKKREPNWARQQNSKTGWSEISNPK